ncbi:MAG: hypothetical protein PUI72_07465 [Prevotellaceae bacterium]|nr:hypothetical protein [Prevotellaceae bacterium]MDY6200614.1 hypothetical protein [Prevotella sp.]
MKIYVNIPEFYHENCSSCWTKFIKEQAKDTIGRIMEEEKFALFYDDDQNILFPYFEEEDRHSHWVYKDNKRYFIQEPEFELLFEWEESDFAEILEEMDEEEIQEEKVNARERYMSQLSKIGLESEADIKIPKDYVYIGSYVPALDKEIELTGLIVEFDDDGNELLSPKMFKNTK